MLSSNTSAVSGDAIYVEDVFSTYLYNGTGAAQTITNGIDLSTKGGMVWTKGRNVAFGNVLIDSSRGITKPILSESTEAQATVTNCITALNTTGYTLGVGNTNQYETNASGGYTFASWTFRKQPKFFDVVTWTGNGANRTISHSLGSVPGCIIVKNTSTGGYNWGVYHRSLNGGTTPEGYYVLLNTTGAQAATAILWNNTAPTSTDFTVGTSATVNNTGDTYVAYLFAHDAGGFGLTGTDNVISCGSLTTDGSGQATVTLGYEPQWILTKKRSAAGSNWVVTDSMRTMTTDTSRTLYPNTVTEEEATYSSLQYFGDKAATGFKFSGSASSTYIYIAIRRGPMKVPTDATKVFVPISGSDVNATSNFPVDFFIDNKTTGNGNNSPVGARLTGANAVFTASTAAATSAWFLSTWSQSNTTFSPSAFSTSAALYGFRRAPSFMDVVCYTGTGSAKTVSHSLGVAPELMIVKSRVGAYGWIVYSATTGNGNIMTLQNSDYAYAVAGAWNNTSPTSSVFTVGTYAHTNNSGSEYSAFLFATCPGVSKVGSYTGTGTTKQVDCGFSAGARFVLIKRTDSPNFGDWYVWDTARGIVSGNDPYLLLNSTAAQVTTTDYVDAYSAGFELSSTAPAALNASGGTYIFLAIA